MTKITKMFSKSIKSTYYFVVDFKGLLYFDDGSPTIIPNSIKDVKFIREFYKSLKRVEGKGSYKYIGEFWGEVNYMRCLIAPAIFSYMILKDNIPYLQYSIGQTVKFDPKLLSIDAQTNIICYPLKPEINGVFSNDLTSTFLSQIQKKGDANILNFNGNTYEIPLSIDII